jgi:hypothetical protein
MSFVSTCFGLMKSSSSNYQLEEITRRHGLARQYYHALTACRRVRERTLALPSRYFYERRSRCVPCAWFS